MNCTDAVAALVKSIESGTPLDDEQREHLRTCARCSTLLASARDLQTAVESADRPTPPIDADLPAAEREVALASRNRKITLVAAASTVIVAAAGIYAFLTRGPSSMGRLGAAEAGFLIIALLVVAIPAATIVWLVRAARHSATPLYKRLKPGRQLSGVCLGLAERLNVNVTIVRIAFLVALFADGFGFWLYVLLDLAMPVHPADREHLLRFRFRRWRERRQTA